VIGRWLLAAASMCIGGMSMAQGQPALDTPPRVVGDAIPAPLTAMPGDAARGQEIVANRQVGLCLLCHTGPLPQPHLHGNLAPSLAGAGTRLSAGQLRLRIVDARRVNPQTVMPSYLRSDGFTRVNKQWRNQPVLNRQQIEDVVAYLQTLRD